MEDSVAQRIDVAILSSYIKYVTTGTEDIQREALSSLSTTEIDQPGGSSDKHFYVPSNGISTQDQAQAQAQVDTEPQVSTSVLSLQSVVIHHSTIPDGHG